MFATKPNSRYELVAGSNGSEVWDKDTNLVWQRCLAGTTWQTSYCAGTATQTNWVGVLTYAKNYPNSTLTGTGSLKWRVPNRNEAASLIERACWGPALNGTYFVTGLSQNMSYLSALGGYLATSTTMADDANGVYVIDFSSGQDIRDMSSTSGGYSDKREYNMHIRLVRDGP